MKYNILIIDDEKVVRDNLKLLLDKPDYKILLAENGKNAFEIINDYCLDIIISDINLPDMTGLEILETVKKDNLDIPFIIITAYASWETARRALRAGAFDYLAKPFKTEDVELLIEKAIQHRNLLKENFRLKQQLNKGEFSGIIGSSSKMKDIFKLLDKVAPTNSIVLITGESGTGKELAARAIHNKSFRKDKDFVVFNCAAVPANLLESELFGYIKGSFTGAVKSKAGYLELADKGTLFFDEIGELPQDLQVKLLRIVEGYSFRRVGGTEDVEIDARIIAATNRNLEEMVNKNSFREDLYYRLAVFNIKLPPLRERAEDIGLLAHHFLQKYNKELAKNIRSIDKEVIDIFNKYPWPGNVRELQNIIEHSVILEETDKISVSSLPKMLLVTKLLRESKDDIKDGSLDEKMMLLEKKLIEDKLKEAEGNKNKAARLLGISRQSLQYKLKKFNI